MKKLKSNKLTDTQIVILSEASKHDDLNIYPIPASVKAKGGALTRVLTGLLRGELIAERPAGPKIEVWRTNDAGDRLTLVATDAGLAAIGIAATTANAPEPSKPIAATNSAPFPRDGTKAAVLADHLRRKNGATLDELMIASGWQAHSVRGFLSGTMKKKLGLKVISEKIDGIRRYRIAA